MQDKRRSTMPEAMSRNNTGHGITKCKECDRIISQCKCMDKNKPITYSVCSECFDLKKGGI